MNDYIVVAVVTVISVTLVLGTVWWKFGGGLITKIFRITLISTAIGAYISFVMGKNGITFVNLSTTLAVGITLVLTVLIMIKKTIIADIQHQSDAVSKVVRSLTVTSNEAAASAEEQSSTVTQVSTAVEEIHQMSQNTANTSQDVVNVAAQAVTQGREGQDAVREALTVMERLAQTTDFVEVVNHVAEQSNLLAFNAGIEAAKAEEYGRGFSVVASEVRNLAEQSKQAAAKIREALRYTRSGQQAIESTDKIVVKLGSVLEDTSDKVRQISGAALQQSAGIKQISDAMGNLVQSGRHTALTSKQIKEAAAELATVTYRLSVIIHGQDVKEILGRQDKP